MIRHFAIACVSASLVLAAIKPAGCQTVYALLVADASPSAGWGEFKPHITMDVTLMFSVLINHVPDDRRVLRPMTIEHDDKANPRAILAALETLTPGPEDTLLVYYSGHGAADDRGHFFDLVGGKLYRSDLLAAMSAKGARLDVLLTDCCSARSDGHRQVAAVPKLDPPEDFTPIFRSLFVDARGSVDINGCAPGESAFFSPTSNDPSVLPGSLFTKAIEEYLRVNRDREVPWDDLLLGVSLTVHLQFRQGYPRGVKFAKGAPVQRDQNVYAAAYPGMPDNRGPRAGLVVRNDGSGVLIVEVADGSPGTRAWDVTGGQYVALPTQQRIVAVNGRSVANVDEFKSAVADSPQVMRVALRVDGNSRDYLMRLRY